MKSCFYFFFFKQKTAYEMRISDWSSDVCSSDLVGPGQRRNIARRPMHRVAIEKHDRAGPGRHGLDAALLDQQLQAQLVRYTIFLAPQRGLVMIVGRLPLAARKSVVSGQRVEVRGDLGGCRSLKNKNIKNTII